MTSKRSVKERRNYEFSILAAGWLDQSVDDEGERRAGSSGE